MQLLFVRMFNTEVFMGWKFGGYRGWYIESGEGELEVGMGNLSIQVSKRVLETQ